MLDFNFFSDEVNFHLSGHVNKENMRFWAQPREHLYRPRSVVKVTSLFGVRRVVIAVSGHTGPRLLMDVR